VKAVPDAAKGDKDVSGHGDGTLDFFMGEWKFVSGNNDVIVRLWCINKPQDTTAPFNFHDYFSYQVLTSVGAAETSRINPGPVANCPYFGGRNVFSGFQNVDDIKKAGVLPTRIDDISWNKDKLAPADQVAQKTINSQKPDGSFSSGKIIKKTNGDFIFSGEFKVDGNFKLAADLTAADKAALQADFNSELNNAINVVYKGDPSGPNEICLDYTDDPLATVPGVPEFGFPFTSLALVAIAFFGLAILRARRMTMRAAPK
jgi:hypothetical protein